MRTRELRASRLMAVLHQLRTTSAHSHHLSIIYGQCPFNDLAPRVSFQREGWWAASAGITPSIEALAGISWKSPMSHGCGKHITPITYALGHGFYIRVSQPQNNWHFDRQFIVIWSNLMHCGSTWPLLITTKNVSRHCQMSPGEQNHPWVRGRELVFYTITSWQCYNPHGTEDDTEIQVFSKLSKVPGPVNSSPCLRHVFSLPFCLSSRDFKI